MVAVWFDCGSAGGGEVGGVVLARQKSPSEDWVLESEDEGGRDETVLAGDPVEGVNEAGRSVVDDNVANCPSEFLGRLTFFLSARMDGADPE